MSRPVDERRPDELREAIVQYLLDHGLANLSLRPLAKSVGSSPRGLLYHFGSKEKMVVEVIAEIRQRQRNTLGRIDAPTFAEASQQVWEQMSSDESEPLFRLFFEAYGIALRNPQLYAAFLHDTIEHWLDLIAEPLHREGRHRAQARAFATVVLAGLRGFMLDFCTTHDRERLNEAVRLWARNLDTLVPPKKAE